MAIINASVTQGTELKTAEASTTVFIADKSLFKLGGFHITQQLAIGAVAGLLLGAIWKS